MAAANPLVFRWGIISTGNIATSFVKDLLLDPKTRDVHDVVHKVTAVGSRSSESAQKFIKDVAGGDDSIKAYGSYQEVFADENVDAVYIGTPHTFHYSNAREALLAKKHVLLEKPATCNAAELQDLINTAKEQNVFFMEAMWTRFLPISKEFKKIVEEGRLGAPVVMWADLSGDFHIHNIPKTHRMLDPALGGGGLLDLGPYPLVWAIMALYEHPSNKATPPSHIVGSMVKTPLTGVDANTSFTLSFAPDTKSGSTLSAQAILSTSINLPALDGPVATIRYEHGFITVAAPIYAPREFTVKYSKTDGQEEETKVVKIDWKGNGWHFQADEVARCASAGKLQSAEWGWDKSLLEMKIFDEVRKQGGYVFPPGVEKVL
ncbi:NAD(P)-binding protein [Athelia psychrophila]|uniref:D-xylose 1-dehydrogenase (NADP(+), D-xylono-1,5-lactone-forming) n=1 Tax=Athelia psychrophila TaxID=1759441 RepID=A0A166PZ17_9AGAM|nr:NAD(P)-binding protein [Fibularhizoctonia sp. CBS 109695]